MGNFIDNIKLRFKQRDILVQLIVVNVAIFLLFNCFNLITALFKIESFSLLKYVAVSSNVEVLIRHIWTIFTYMFVHEGIWHILFNMLMLFVFGRIFLTYFNAKNLGSLYILGGLSGAALFVLAFNTIPLYIDMGHSPMIGASASVMAIIFAAAFYRPNQKVGLLFIGQIKIVYIAIFIFVMDFVLLANPGNPGGHIAHIGGAIVGYIFAKQYLKGKDITRWMSRIIDMAANIVKPNPSKKMKVKFKKRENEYEYNERRNSNSEEIDRILDKIKMSGYSSLNKDEKKHLFDASKK